MPATFDPLGKTWIIPSTAAGSSLVDGQDLRVDGIRWIIDSGGALGNVATITDPDGTTVLWHDVNDTGASMAHVDNKKRRFPKGFKVPTLTIGTLYVELE